jgi:pyruvate dehydrogenase (quinone)
VHVDAVVNRMELAMPPQITAEMAKGFTVDMLKAVLNGRGDEIIGLVQSNLRRRLPLAADSRPRPAVIDLYR